MRNISYKRWFVGLICVLMMQYTAAAQEQDTTAQEKDTTGILKDVFNGNLVKKLSETLTAETFIDSLPQRKSEDILKPYQGKIIRHIYINHIGFNKSIYSPQKNIATRAAKIADALHTETRPAIVRQHLFFTEGNPLNPYKLADNERYLRSLGFILDSRIVADSIEGTDSVDVRVITRDVFSIGGQLNPDPNRFVAGLYEANFLGMAQTVGVTALYSPRRFPHSGLNVYYQKSSIFGSLTNATVGYTQLNNASSYGGENEYAWYFMLERPLVSPYSRFAGGAELSHNWSQNVYVHPDSLFLNYRYNVADFWGGYNIGTDNNINNRARHFVAIRYFNQNFIQQPYQQFISDYTSYNDRQMILGSVAFYRQNFYKTRYVFGFGRTEDVPYGTKLTVTGGWTKELGLERPYISADLLKSFVVSEGHTYSFRTAAGGYWADSGAEDFVFLVSGSLLSKLMRYEKVKIRNSVTAGYSEIFKNKTNILLNLNNHIGGFRPDSLYGFRRLNLMIESTFFTTWSLLGFRFAPFSALEGGLLQQKSEGNTKSQLYPGFSAGIRTRNENLTFGTVEARIYYFPVAVPGVSTFEVKLRTNLRVRFSGRFATAPERLVYN